MFVFQLINFTREMKEIETDIIEIVSLFQYIWKHLFHRQRMSHTVYHLYRAIEQTSIPQTKNESHSLSPIEQ